MRIPIVIITCVVFFTGCELVPPYQPVDFGKTQDGKRYIRDTQRTWRFYIDFIERAIQDELNGKSPGAGFKSWNEVWVSSINTKRNGDQENPEKYVSYIVQRRRELGLPEIDFPSIANATKE